MKTPSTPIELCGPSGTLRIDPADEVALKLAMLFEGIHRQGPLEPITRKYGYRREHYYHLLSVFQRHGSGGLASEKRGPKTNTVRKQQLLTQTIRLRFLDPEASARVIAQKLRQQGLPATQRSVERTITEYGLQKKTLINLTPSESRSLLTSTLQSVAERA